MCVPPFCSVGMLFSCLPIAFCQRQRSTCGFNDEVLVLRGSTRLRCMKWKTIHASVFPGSPFHKTGAQLRLKGQSVVEVFPPVIPVLLFIIVISFQSRKTQYLQILACFRCIIIGIPFTSTEVSIPYQEDTQPLSRVKPWT